VYLVDTIDASAARETLAVIKGALENPALLKVQGGGGLGGEGA
jgi:hypothetical protein